MDDRLNLLGLAYRARKIVLGEEALKQISKVKLLILASDISEKSRERFLKKCHFYGIECLMEHDSSLLSRALGKNNVKVIGITDDGFKRKILGVKDKEE